jgi:hypothetical protein
MSRPLFTPRLAAAAGAVVLAVAAATPIAARLAIDPIPYKCPPCRSIMNAYVRADMSPAGTWTMGTTGGDPDTPDDDNKLMIYGFIPGGLSDVGSSYTTVRLIGPNGTMDAMPTEAETVRQQTDPSGTSMYTLWRWTQPYRAAVTQTLSLADNPFSGRPDATWIRYELKNEDTVQLRAGLRAMLDVKLGNNDGAPYIVPGVGAVSMEREFFGDDVPPFWLAFESPVYDPRQLRSVGLLRGEGLTSPDRLLIAWWVGLRSKEWDYAVNPTQSITIDSAVALYFDPLPLEPGATRVVTTSYGVAGNRGGEVFLTSPSASCGSEVPVSLFVTNFGGQALTGGSASLTLPPGLALSAGETATKPMATIDLGKTGSVVWRVTAGPVAQGDYPLSADATFAQGSRFHADLVMHVTCAIPTATPVTPSPTPASTAVPTATPYLGPEACTYILARVPPAAVAEALAAPQEVGGWGMLCQPNLPPSPWNVKRDRLALTRANSPYHPQFNPLVFKCQCP